MLSKLHDQSPSRSSFENFWVVTSVSISIGPTDISARFGEISFNYKGEDKLVVVLLRALIVHHCLPYGVQNSLATTTVFDASSLLYPITDPLSKSFG